MLLDSEGKAGVIASVAEASGLSTLIETGTGYGDLPYFTQDCFERIITIEADRTHYGPAASRLNEIAHIDVRFGRSEELLPVALAEVDRSCVLWLDAHEDVIGGRSALNAELAALALDRHHHVILIDDARLCVGRKGWPTVDGIEGWAAAYGYGFTLTGDIIVLS